MDQDRRELGSVTTEIREGIATITFFHPAHNSLPGKLLKGLCEAFDSVGQNEKARVVVLKSEGDRTFCAGASFDELAAVSNVVEGKEFFMGFANVINAMRRCPKLIIGRVQGKAIGGGVGLAAATDYCMATKYASVKLSELAIGIGPFVIGPAVERKIGVAAMSHLAINATEWQTATWAKERGLFAEVFDSSDQLDDYIDHLGAKLAAANPEAMRLLKKVFWEGAEHWDQLLNERAAISGQLILSEFAVQAVQAFKQKASS